jgi:RnfABCDGE-type electron transport complex D subunit
MKNTQGICLSAPHIHDWRTTAKATWFCSLTLVPVVIASVVLYGNPALYIWSASLFGAIAAETLVGIFIKRLSLADGSTVLTGLLVACAIPPGAPLYIPVSASMFSILAIKTVFGGLGSNWMNPALGGIAFAYANWPVAMRRFLLPSTMNGFDSLSTATPLEFARAYAGPDPIRVMDVFRNAEYPLSSMDISITGFLNDSLFSHIGARLPEGYIDLLIGMKSGALGESALLAVLFGSILLLALGLIKLEIPLSIVFAFAALSRIFGTGLPGERLFAGDMLFALSGGGFMLATFYMATDPVTSPVHNRVAVFYGLGIGILAFVFRRWGAHAEGIVYAILAMNILVPTVERVLMPGFKAKVKVGEQ